MDSLLKTVHNNPNSNSNPNFVLRTLSRSYNWVDFFPTSLIYDFCFSDIYLSILRSGLCFGLWLGCVYRVTAARGRLLSLREA